jgi:hypothetical protein
MAPHQQILLDQQMETLPFSSELKSICAENHIHTLSDLLNIEVYFWQQKLKGFNYHHQHEIVCYLQQNHLLEFVKED